MNRFVLLVLCFFSIPAFSAQIENASQPKNLKIDCGNQERGRIGLTVSGTQGIITLNFVTRAANVQELSDGSYQIRVPEYPGKFIIMSKGDLQATTYIDTDVPPYMQAIKRVDCTWGRN
jgi:hypothetical protein